MKKYLIEFLGTMFLAFVILATGHWAAIGIALAVAVLLGGGAFNPAVVLSLYNVGKLAKVDVIPYILAEILGGLSAFYLYKYLVKK